MDTELDLNAACPQELESACDRHKDLLSGIGLAVEALARRVKIEWSSSPTGGCTASIPGVEHADLGWRRAIEGSGPTLPKAFDRLVEAMQAAHKAKNISIRSILLSSTPK